MLIRNADAIRPLLRTALALALLAPVAACDPPEGDEADGDVAFRAVGVVTSLTLINADTDQPIPGYSPIADGATIALSALPTTNLNIRADTSGTLGSVRFGLDANTNVRTESAAPYAMYGDTNGDYNAGSLALGAHTLTATPYAGASAGGEVGAPLQINITVVADPPAPSGPVVGLTLINADTDQPIAGFSPIPDGATIDLATLPTTNLNVRADVSQAVGSVRFGLDANANAQTETTAPYALFGDTSGNYNPGSFGLGAHTLTATPWSGAGATGTAGPAYAVDFTVVSGGSAPLIPGQIRMDPNNPHYMVYNRDANGDGRLDPFYLAGVGGPEHFLYEPLARQQEIVDRLIDDGGNGIYFHSIREDGAGGGDGQSFENPFNNHADPNSGINAATLDAWEDLFTQLDNAGITLFFFLYDDHVKPWGCTVPLPAAEQSYVSTIVNKFKHHKHLIWITQEEFQFACSGTGGIAKATALAQEIRKHDPHHPIGVHHMNGQAMQFGTVAAVDLFVQQTGVSSVTNMHGSAGTQGWGDWGYVMGEAHSWHMNLLHAQNRATLRQSHWGTALAGGSVLKYNAFECDEIANICGVDPPTSRDPHDPDTSTLGDLRRLQQFMESTRFNEMAPNDAIKAGGTLWALADASKSLYILYSNATPTSLGATGMSAGTYQLKWFDPATGTTVNQTKTAVAGTNTFPVPPGLGAEVALYLRK